MHKTRFALLATLFSFSAITLATAQQTPVVSEDMSAAEFADAVGGTLQTGGPSLIVRGRLDPTTYLMTYTKSSTGWDEHFVLGLPSNPNDLKPLPLLVVWHQWAASEQAAYLQTSFFQEGRSRNWYVIAPLGAHQRNWGIDYAQKNIEELLLFMNNYFTLLNGYPPFDKTRIYGVGFSMGGGGVTSYASRHLNPEKLPYAAIVNHTGTLSSARTWTPGNPELNHHRMFGSPFKNPFAYFISSAIHVWPFQNTVDLSSDLVRNVPALPIWTTRAIGDHGEGRKQCDLFASHLGTLGFGNHIYSPNLPPSPPGFPRHSWESLNEVQACDFLALHSFNKPTGRARILADRDERYYDISVKQANPGVLSPFSFDVTYVGTNIFALTTSRETSAFEIHTLDMGLDPTNTTGTLTLRLNGPIGTSAPVTLKVHDLPPTTTTATRTPIHPNSTVTFSGGVMTIYEPDPGSSPVWTTP